jgi:hypothetical protein
LINLNDDQNQSFQNPGSDIIVIIFPMNLEIPSWLLFSPNNFRVVPKEYDHQKKEGKQHEVISSTVDQSGN